MDELSAALDRLPGGDPWDAVAAPVRVRRAAAPASDWLVWRPALRSRNGVAYAVLRTWPATGRALAIERFKLAKETVDPAVIAAAAAELATEALKLIGRAVTVANVPCGHSCRSDCFGKRLAEATAGRMGATFAELFADRFVAGSSHPKEIREAEPVRLLRHPRAVPVLLVDDIATSGAHLEECAAALRAIGAPVLCMAWIGGK